MVMWQGYGIGIYGAGSPVFIDDVTFMTLLKKVFVLV